MDIDNILLQLGFSTNASYTPVSGGKDSVVYKLVVEDGKIFALRIISADRLHQFKIEQKLIALARDQGIPAPVVYFVQAIGEHAVMVMEWVSGKTVLSALQEEPECAAVLGYNFGVTHAKINKILLTEKWQGRTWLTPVTEEEEILKAVTPVGNHLLHLDYHPLNVLTDGEKITGVIDWMNAAKGDFRFDYSRTLSILELEGSKVFQNDMETLGSFRKGWESGYESIFGSMEDMAIFYAWAGKRMQRDMANRMLPGEYITIEQWIQNWLLYQ